LGYKLFVITSPLYQEDIRILLTSFKNNSIFDSKLIMWLLKFYFFLKLSFLLRLPSIPKKWESFFYINYLIYSSPMMLKFFYLMIFISRINLMLFVVKPFRNKILKNPLIFIFADVSRDSILSTIRRQS